MLHFITFNNDKNIMIVANIRGTTIEIIDKIRNIYAQLPFFLKAGIKNLNQQSMIFDNGCRIKSSARSKTPAIGFTIDFLYLDEFAHIPSNIIEPYYQAAFPTVSAIENSKIVSLTNPTSFKNILINNTLKYFIVFGEASNLVENQFQYSKNQYITINNSKFIFTDALGLINNPSNKAQKNEFWLGLQKMFHQK